MVPTANNNTPTPEPTGDLEQLFRQKLGEAEVAPRPHLWEQLDHELLVQQNETYRRRLVWHRWVAAACILLFLGAGSWLTVRQADLSGPGATLATTAPRPAGPVGGPAGLGAQPATAADGAAVAYGDAPAADYLTVAKNAILGRTAPSRSEAGRLAQPVAPGALADAVSAGSAQRAGVFAHNQTQTPGQYHSTGAFAAASLPVASIYERVLGSAHTSFSGAPASAASWPTAPGSQSSQALSGLLRAGQPDTLKAALLSAPLMALAPASAPVHQDEKKPEAPAHPKRWRLIGAYAASAYNPNMRFSDGRSVSSVNGVGGAMAYRAATAYEQAAEEYRQNLRPGFAQRVALTVSYAATRHWTLSAGVAAAEQRATSRTSHHFLDGKLPVAVVTTSADRGFNSLAPPRPAQLRTAQYRYRTAGIPVSVRYGSPKNGLSLYAKVGAAVDVLLNSHSELEGVPEATATYSLTSPNSPYRKVQSSVNAGAGVRYKPTNAQWSIALGPTAEAAMSTLNTNALQTSYQTRPYALGMEASVEFGGKTAVVVH